MSLATEITVRRARKADRSRRVTQAGNSIGRIRPCVNPEKRERLERHLRVWLRFFFPSVFDLPWAAYHRTCIGKIETAAIEGGRFAFAVPRGGGKSSICEKAVTGQHSP